MSRNEIELIDITRKETNDNVKPKDSKKKEVLKDKNNKKDTKYPVKQEQKKWRTRIGIIFAAAFTAIGSLFSIHNHNEKQEEAKKDVRVMIDSANLDVGRNFKNLNPDNMGPNLKMYMDALYKKYPNLDTIINTDDSEAHYPGFNEDLNGMVTAYLLDQAGVDLIDKTEFDVLEKVNQGDSYRYTINLNSFNEKLQRLKYHYDDGDCVVLLHDESEDVYKDVYDEHYDEYYDGDEGDVLCESADPKIMAVTDAFYELQKGNESKKLGTDNNFGSLLYELWADEIGTRGEIPSSEEVNRHVDRGNYFIDRIRTEKSNSEYYAEEFYKEIKDENSGSSKEER